MLKMARIVFLLSNSLPNSCFQRKLNNWPHMHIKSHNYAEKCRSQVKNQILFSKIQLSLILYLIILQFKMESKETMISNKGCRLKWILPHFCCSREYTLICSNMELIAIPHIHRVFCTSVPSKCVLSFPKIHFSSTH